MRELLRLRHSEVGGELWMLGARRRRCSRQPGAAIVIGRKGQRHVVTCRAVVACGDDARGAV